MRFSTSLIEFQDQFPDEDSCWRYLREVRWPHGFVCSRCGGRESSFIRTRRLEQCRSCRYQASVTAGTIFHRTRKPLRVWFLGIFFLARHKKGISSLQFQKDAGIGNYQTAWTMMHKLRSALGRRSGELLSGLVEADEAYVGGPRPGVRGRGAANKSAVAVAVERRAPCISTSSPMSPGRASGPSCVAPSKPATRPCGQTIGVATGRWRPPASTTSPRPRAIPRTPPRSCRGPTW